MSVPGGQVPQGQQANTPQVGGNPATPATPQGGVTNTPAPQNTGAGPTSQVDGGDDLGNVNLTPEQMAREITKLRRLEAEHRTARHAAEAKVTEYERATLTKEEQLAAKLSDAERERSELVIKQQERMLSYEVKLQAAALGIVDPDAAAKLMDVAQIEYDDAGAPKNISKLLKELVAAKPYLAGSNAQGGQQTPPKPGASPTNPPSGNGRAAGYTQTQIAAMTPTEYKQHKAAIFAAQREGRILPG